MPIIMEIINANWYWFGPLLVLGSMYGVLKVAISIFREEYDARDYIQK